MYKQRKNPLMHPGNLGKSAVDHPPWTKTAIAAILELTFFAHNGIHAASAARGDDAEDLLKEMAEYVLAQKTIQATYDTDVEIVTTELQKLSFGASGQVILSRPNHFHAGRVGGYAIVELIFDGKTLTILGKNLNAYAQLESPGTLEQLVERIRGGCTGSLPGVDLLLTRSYEDLTDGITDAKHVGRGIIGDIECEHLAFRTNDADWQLWVQTGRHPIPRKYIITNKNVAASPQYAIHFKDWRTDVTAGESTFIFSPPPDARKVDLTNPAEADEILARIAARLRRHWS